MQTIKTAVVVVLLLAVCYGAFVALNAPEPEMPASMKDWLKEDTELDDLVGIGMVDLGDEVSSLDSAVPIDLGQTMEDLQASEASPANTAAGSSTMSLPQISGGPNTAGVPSSSDPQPAFPALPSGPPAMPPSMPSMTTGVDVSSFPALQTSPPNSNSGTNALVGDQRPVPSDRALGSAGNLIPPMLDTSSLDNGFGRDEPAVPSETLVSAAGPSGSKLPTAEFAVARSEALKLAEAGELKSALEMLSPYFDSPELSYEQRTDLVDILDALCREVIYSRRHLVEPAYVVKPQDTVASVAKAHQISPEFLNAINGLGDSKALVPGNKLKVVQGPFRAVADLERGELTLFLFNLYGGRFPFSTGGEPTPRVGSYAVLDRRRDRTYYSSGSVVQADDPRNPYGGYWLHLGEDLCIHGTPATASSELENAGCISLAPIDAQDVFNILVVDSPVEIRP